MTNANKLQWEETSEGIEAASQIHNDGTTWFYEVTEVTVVSSEESITDPAIMWAVDAPGELLWVNGAEDLTFPDLSSAKRFCQFLEDGSLEGLEEDGAVLPGGRQSLVVTLSSLGDENVTINMKFEPSLIMEDSEQFERMTVEEKQLQATAANVFGQMVKAIQED